MWILSKLSRGNICTKKDTAPKYQKNNYYTGVHHILATTNWSQRDKLSTPVTTIDGNSQSTDTNASTLPSHHTSSAEYREKLTKQYPPHAHTKGGPIQALAQMYSMEHHKYYFPNADLFPFARRTHKTGIMANRITHMALQFIWQNAKDFLHTRFTSWSGCVGSRSTKEQHSYTVIEPMLGGDYTMAHRHGANALG